MTDPALLGGLVGLVIGIADFLVLGQVIAAMVRSRPVESQGSRAVINLVRYVQLVLFPVAGWFVGPFFASNIAG